MSKSDPVRERIKAFNQARGGGVLVHKAGRGYSLLSERTGAPIARLRPTGDAGAVVEWRALGGFRPLRHSDHAAQ